HGTTSPLESGVGWITKFTKDSVNSAALPQQKGSGIQRKLIAIELDEKGIPRQGYDIVDEKGDMRGKATSGTMSPSLGTGIGMGFVPIELAGTGNKIYIQIRKNAVPATLVETPFYKGS